MTTVYVQPKGIPQVVRWEGSFSIADAERRPLSPKTYRKRHAMSQIEPDTSVYTSGTLMRTAIIIYNNTSNTFHGLLEGVERSTAAPSLTCIPKIPITVPPKSFSRPISVVHNRPFRVRVASYSSPSKLVYTVPLREITDANSDQTAPYPEYSFPIVLPPSRPSCCTIS